MLWLIQDGNPPIFEYNVLCKPQMMFSRFVALAQFKWTKRACFSDFELSVKCEASLYTDASVIKEVPPLWNCCFLWVEHTVLRQHPDELQRSRLVCRKSAVLCKECFRSRWALFLFLKAPGKCLFWLQNVRVEHRESRPPFSIESPARALLL